MENFSKIKTLLLITLVCLPRFGLATEACCESAEQIRQRWKIIKAPETLKIERIKQAAKDWKTLDDKHFRVSYPPCYIPSGNEGVIFFAKGKDCPDHQEKNSHADGGIEINHEYLKEIGSMDLLASASKVIYQQDAKLGELDGRLVVSLFDRIGPSPVLSWRFFFICGKKGYSGSWSTPGGEPTIKVIEAKKFEIPADYKEILSTFSCK